MRIKNKNTKHLMPIKSLLLFSIFISPIFALAEGGGSHFGVLYGISVPDAANVNPYELFGVRGSTYLLPAFDLGGYYLQSSDNDVGTGGQQYKYSLTGVEAVYHIGGSNGDAFLGLRVGITKVHTNLNGTNYIFSPYHYGAVCGYDYLLASWFSLGFEGSFLAVQKSTTTSSAAPQTLDGFGILSFLMSFQFRL